MKNWPGLRVLLVGALVTMACSAVSQFMATPTPKAVPTQSAAARQLGVFDAAFAAVRDQYVRSDYGGVDWNAIGAQYRTQVAAGLTDDAFAGLMRAMLAKLPPGAASYQTRAERLAQDTGSGTSYSGIGAFIAFRKTPQPHIVILATIEGSPAAAAGLAPHDSLYAVNGVPFSLSDELSPTDRIRGQAGTTLTVTVQTPGAASRQVQLQRAPIQATDALRGGNLTAVNVAYYRVPVVSDSTLAAAIAGDLQTISQTTHLNGIILDLRVARSDANPWPLSEMLTLFGNGDMGEFYTRTATTPLSVSGIDAGGSQTLPLVILVASDTAGTPEVFAAALQSSHRAVVVGGPTLGGVQGYNTIVLPDGSRISVAVSAYRTTGKLDLGRAGLTPDHLVSADWDSYTTNDDPILQEALTLLPIH
jgi:C-terminal processing protease CtpA/Prc